MNTIEKQLILEAAKIIKEAAQRGRSKTAGSKSTTLLPAPEGAAALMCVARRKKYYSTISNQ